MEDVASVSLGLPTFPCLVSKLQGEGGARLKGRGNKHRSKDGRSRGKHLRTRSLARRGRERGKKTATEARPLALQAGVLQRLHQGLGEEAG